MTSPVSQIKVACPACGTVFETSYRASMNLALDNFDAAYIRRMTTAKCPTCRKVLDLGSLVVGEDRVWRFGTDGVPKAKSSRGSTRRGRTGGQPKGGSPEPPEEIHSLIWSSRGPDSLSIRLEAIDHFDARGKRRVYGQGDHFGRFVANLDIWRAKDGRLFARFWSRNRDVDWESYEIIGFPDPPVPSRKGEGFDEQCVPECLRRAYDNWVLLELYFRP